jgi:hypothetical protein
LAAAIKLSVSLSAGNDSAANEEASAGKSVSLSADNGSAANEEASAGSCNPEPSPEPKSESVPTSQVDTQAELLKQVTLF